MTARVDTLSYSSPMTLIRRLAALIAICRILAPLLVFQFVWRLVANTGDATVVNGVLSPPSGSGPAAWAEALITAPVWAWALMAAVRAYHGDPQPVRTALRRLPAVLGAMVTAVALVVAALLCLMVFQSGEVLPPVLLGIGIAVITAAFMVRLALVLPIAALSDTNGSGAIGEAFALIRGRALNSGIVIVLGVAVAPLAAKWFITLLREETTGRAVGLALAFVADLTLVAIAMIQATTLFAVHKNLTTESANGLPGEGGSGTSAKRTRAAYVAAALSVLLVPTVLSGVVAGSHRLPEISTGDLERGMLIAVGWGSGGHPVIVGQQEIIDCLDDRCVQMASTPLSVIMFDPTGGAVVAPDGSVVALGQDELERCDMHRACRSSPGMLDPLARSEAEAIGLGPSGEILIATATRVGEEPSMQLGLVHCLDELCQQTHTTVLGVVKGFRDQGDRGTWRPRTLGIGVDKNGRVVVAYKAQPADQTWVAWCESSACAQPAIAVHGDPRASSMPTDEELISLRLGRMIECPFANCDPALWGISPTTDGFATVTSEAVEPDGPHIQIGSPGEGTRRAILLHCPDVTCQGAQRIRLNEYWPGTSNLPDPQLDDIWWIAANPDGRLLLVQDGSPHVIITESRPAR